MKAANRNFYDIVGPNYEGIDGRRTPRMSAFLSEQIRRIAQDLPREAFLDLGCGNGFLSKVALKHFRKGLAVDISLNVLRELEAKGLYRAVAEADLLPLKPETLDMVMAVAVLHHCYSFERMFREIHRALCPGGVFFSDHDLDSSFFRRHAFLIRLYRRVKNDRLRYSSRFPRITKDLFALTEYHENGIDTNVVQKSLFEVGFRDIKLEFHWYGMSSWSDRIFGQRTYDKGHAPLVRIIARK